jgi:hypothetical protein
MPRLLAVGGGLLLVLGIIAAIAVTLGVGRSGSPPSAQPPQPSGGLTMSYPGPAQRSADYTSFTVHFTNGSSDAATNPQTRVLVNLQDHEWRCQGYTDPSSGAVVFEVADVSAHPLVIPPGQEVTVQVLCRVPDAPLDSAQVELQ